MFVNVISALAWLCFSRHLQEVVSWAPTYKNTNVTKSVSNSKQAVTKAWLNNVCKHFSHDVPYALNLDHGCPNFWLAWAALTEMELSLVAYKTYTITDVYK